MGRVRSPGASAQGVRRESATAEAPADRSVPAAPHRPGRPRGRPAWHTEGPADRGQDPACRTLGGQRRSDRARAHHPPDRVGPEPLQRGGPPVRGRARVLRARRNGLPAVVSPGGRELGAAGPGRPGRPTARRYRGAGGDRLAAPAVAGHAADTRHVDRTAPGGEHEGRSARARRRKLPRTRWRHRPRRTMKAIRVHAPGGPEALRYEDGPRPRPGAGQRVVKIEAAGVNFIDVHHRTGLYKAPLPLTLGQEAAGAVAATGPEVSDVKVGARVAYAAVQGAYAEYAVVPADRVVVLPDGVSSKQAAAVVLQGITAHYLASTTYALKPGDTCLVHASAGGVGLLLCQDRKSTRLNSSHGYISYAVFCLKKKTSLIAVVFDWF